MESGRGKELSAGARQDGEMGLKLDRGHVNSITLLASLYINNKEYDKALALLDEGLKRDPEQIGLRTLKAKIHVDKGETDKVLVLFEEIVQQEPSKLNHRYGLASFYASIKQLDEAEKALRDVIALAPESVEPKLALAEFLLNRRDKTLAEKELLAFIQQEPGSYPLKFGPANLYEVLGQLDKARNIYQTVIEMAGTEPQGLTARTKLALLSFRNRDFEEVSRLLEEVLEENPRASLGGIGFTW